MWMLVISVVLLLVAAVVVSLPLLRGTLEPYALEHAEDDDFSERDALLDALSDLEESYGVGKLSQADYDAQKQRLQLRYIEVVEGRAPQA